MPAVSKSQRRLMGACEHGADYEACPKDMTKEQMHDFATTKETGLPQRKTHAPRLKRKGRAN